MYDYGPSSNFQGFDFLTSYVSLGYVFFSGQKVWNFKLWAEPNSI